MNAFDEVCALEKQARDQGLALGKARDLVAHCSRLLREMTFGIGSARLRFENIRRQIDGLRHDHPVVLLSEFEQLLYQRDQIRELLDTKNAERLKLERQCLEAGKSIPGLEKTLISTQDKLSTFNRVIPFRR